VKGRLLFFYDKAGKKEHKRAKNVRLVLRVREKTESGWRDLPSSSLRNCHQEGEVALGGNRPRVKRGVIRGNGNRAAKLSFLETPGRLLTVRKKNKSFLLRVAQGLESQKSSS